MSGFALTFPVFETQTNNAAELARIVSDQREIVRESRRRNQGTVIALNATVVGGVAASFWATGDTGVRR